MCIVRGVVIEAVFVYWRAAGEEEKETGVVFRMLRWCEVAWQESGIGRAG